MANDDRAHLPHARQTHARAQKIIAIHEAGHAVVARLLGATVNHVAMFATDGSWARAGANIEPFMSAATDRDSRIEAAKKDAVIALAGPNAQQKFKPQKFKVRRGYLPHEWSSDYNHVDWLILNAAMLETDPTFEVGGNGRTIEPTAEQHTRAAALFNEAALKAKSFIEACWPAIEQTADELLRRRIIIGDEIDKIMMAARRDIEKDPP